MKVFPTTVGMNRRRHGGSRWVCRVPHDRGDEPGLYSAFSGNGMCSPRPWG